MVPLQSKAAQVLDDLKDYKASNSRAMLWLEVGAWLVAGPVIVYLVALLTLALV